MKGETTNIQHGPKQREMEGQGKGKGETNLLLKRGDFKKQTGSIQKPSEVVR